MTPAFSGGKMYLPFGKFNSNMVSDPLILELTETNNTLALFGLTGALWSLHAGFFSMETRIRLAVMTPSIHELLRW